MNLLSKAPKSKVMLNIQLHKNLKHTQVTKILIACILLCLSEFKIHYNIMERLKNDLFFIQANRINICYIFYRISKCQKQY